MITGHPVVFIMALLMALSVKIILYVASNDSKYFDRAPLGTIAIKWIYAFYLSISGAPALIL